MTTIALVGPDGSGKSTIAQAVVARTPIPSRYRYMGINLDHDTVVLPTTRLALELKRRRGGRPDLVARSARPSGTPSLLARLRRWSIDGVRLAVVVSEEWYRQALVWNDERRGLLVVTDRHFLCDALANDVAGPSRRTWLIRLHDSMLRRLYPRPDTVVVLDAPSEVLQERRPDVDPSTLEELRSAYRGLGDMLSGVDLIDASGTVDVVADRIVRLATTAATDADPVEPPRLASAPRQDAER